MILKPDVSPIPISEKPFTYNYSQPSEYRFSMDSIEMAFRLGMAYRETEHNEQLSVLDVCSGCGVLGFEFEYFEKRVRKIDFVEVQENYIPHFEANRGMAGGASEKFRFLHQNYESLLSPEFANEYDIVLCNPPYFRKGHGTLAPSQFKNRCRFFLDSDFQTLVRVTQHVLSPKGCAYLILRGLQEHGFDAIKEMKNMLAGACVVEELSPVRTARFVRLMKLG
jgi:tRNA1Val (adenine37-N6)-methyltransferase